MWLTPAVLTCGGARLAGVPVVTLVLLSACSEDRRVATQPSAFSPPARADITLSDRLQYVRPAARITRSDLVSSVPRFEFEIPGPVNARTCESELWDGTTATCVGIKNVPTDSVTLYVMDPARARGDGMAHAAYAADSVSFRGHALPTAPCRLSDVPPTCALLSIDSFSGY